MKEQDIRPRELFDEYLRLSLKDAELIDQNKLVGVECVACGSVAGVDALNKNGFQYRRCQDCGTLYCSPRPSAQSLDEFYEASESSRFWATRFFPAVAEARREKLFRPKAKQIQEMCERFDLKPESICDVGAGYGIFLEELGKLFPDARLYGVEPSPELSARCREIGIETLESTAEHSGEWAGRFDLVISSEVIEHVYSPRGFIEALARLLKPGGRVLLTGLGYEGFDILTLQEASNSIFPPHHINFLSVKGFEKLMEGVGLTGVDVWTPGRLDVDIVRSSGLGGEFMRVLESRGPEVLARFQEFLSNNQLSSHVWASACKKI